MEPRFGKAVWILGIAVGFSGNLPLGPATTNEASGSATSAPVATPPPTLITKTPSAQRETSQGTPVYSIFKVAHVVNSVSVKSTHLEPVIPLETKQ